jgi:2-dehydropantoate 2-reductase
MRHAILGAGGVGGLIGAVLANAGHDVTLVVRPGTENHYPGTLALDSPFGHVRARARVVAELQRPADILWIAVKATQLSAAVTQIPATAGIQAIVPLLNGIDHIDSLRDRFGKDKVIPATIAVESERVAPGQIVQRSPFARLRVAHRGSAIVADSLDSLRRFGFDCAVVEDEVTLLWSKLVLLAPIALSTTAARAAIGEVLAVEDRRAKLRACVREACAVAAAAGARVDANAVTATIEALPAQMRSSMQKDQASGRPLELEAIAGPILRAGERFAIPVSATAELAQACAGLTHAGR